MDVEICIMKEKGKMGKEEAVERDPDFCGCKKPAKYVFANGSYCAEHVPGWTAALVEQGASEIFDKDGHIIAFRNAEGLPGRNPDFPICYGGYDELYQRELTMRSSKACEACFGLPFDEKEECEHCDKEGFVCAPLDTLKDLDEVSARYEQILNLWRYEYHLLEMQRAYDARRAEVLSREVSRLKRGK